MNDQLADVHGAAAAPGVQAPGGSAAGAGDALLPEVRGAERRRRGEPARRGSPRATGVSTRAAADLVSQRDARPHVMSVPTPEQARQLPAAEAEALLMRLAPLVEMLRLVALAGGQRPGRAATLLSAAEVGARLGLTPAQVYRRADRWPFARRLGPKTVRFDSAGLDLYLGRSVKP